MKCLTLAFDTNALQLLRKVFVGHYSVAFAAKSDRNTIPLCVLFIAVEFLDYIWATLVLLGIEKLRVIKRIHGRQHARFGLALVIVQIGDTYMPRSPLTDESTVLGVWIFYTLFVLIAFAVEKIGTHRKTAAL